MNDTGDTKDDVKLPDGEVGEKIEKLFKVEEKDTSKYHLSPSSREDVPNTILDVIVLTSMGEQSAVEAKEAPKGS